MIIPTLIYALVAAYFFWDRRTVEKARADLRIVQYQDGLDYLQFMNEFYIRMYHRESKAEWLKLHST